MKFDGCIWSDLPLSTGIATLVCYAGVFHDVIGIEEMASRLGVSGREDFYTSLNELHREGRIVLEDGYAGLPDLRDKIRLKAAKIETTAQLINSRLEDLQRLGKNPVVKFVGISGSLAAQNPTSDRNAKPDVDIFLITRSQCLWLFVIPSYIRNVLFKEKKEPRLCCNFIMDESSVEVSNKNFFTATDIRNLVPLSGPETYRWFLQSNRWVDYYYPGFSTASPPMAARSTGTLVIKSLYVLFNILRCIRRVSLAPLRNLSFKMDSSENNNFNRVSVRLGGYQALVHRRFIRLSAKWYPDLVDAALVEKLFPDELSDGIRRGDTAAVKIDAEMGLMFDSKYG